MENILLLADSYKITHHLQYPPGTTKLLSYFESRGGKFNRTVFYGLQYILKRWLCQRVTQQMVDEAEEVLKAHFGKNVFNRKGWEYIISKHDGKLPLRIRAVPEGSVIPTKNVLFTVENTDPEVPWLVNYFETVLVQVWYPMTVCTSSFMQRLLIKEYLEQTADTTEGLPFKLHDFGYRGSTSVESAGIGGSAHLVSFQGTDTLAGIMFARKYYGPADSMPGMSIPAAEHSTMTTWGPENEIGAARNMLESFPEGLVAIVSDSYNIWDFLDKIVGTELKDLVVNRNGTLVVRPDSGHPPDVVCKALTILEAKFGSSTNSKGFKVLPPYIRVIQGDGISYEMIRTILEAMKEIGWSVDNITFGSGGALLQKVNRDTQKCAYKCCMAEINGKRVDVYKDPVTDPGKTSKRGSLTLIRDASARLKTVDRQSIRPKEEDLLQVVFEDGCLMVDQSFEEVRARAVAEGQHVKAYEFLDVA